MIQPRVVRCPGKGRSVQKVGLPHRQGGLRLVQVGVRGRDVDEHERFGGAAQRIAHEHRQLLIAVRDVRLRIEAELITV